MLIKSRHAGSNYGPSRYKRDALPLCYSGTLRRPGIEPGAIAWKATMLPLHYRRWDKSALWA